MEFEQILPDARLRDTVVGYWRLSGLEPGRLYVAAPKRHIEFVVNFGAPQIAGKSRLEEPHEYRSCWLTGIRSQPLFLLPTGTSTIFGVVFRDFAVPQWLTGDVRQNPGWSTDLDNSSATARLVEELAACTSLAEAAARFDRFFLARLSPGHRAQQLNAALATCEHQGRATPSDIIAHTALVPSEARALAHSICGVSLRRYLRLARFDRALHLIADEFQSRLADIAHGAGYYDEAHMGHDFLAFYGASPGALRKLRLNSAGLPHHLCRLPN